MTKFLPYRETIRDEKSVTFALLFRIHSPIFYCLDRLFFKPLI
jgi:hypothetical protein